MTTKEKWTPESEVDQATGLSIRRRGRMAELLKISERHLDRLALAGTLPVRDDGYFPVRETIDAYAMHLVDKTIRPSRHDAIRRLQSDAIRKRMEREEPDLMMMVDVLETIDFIAAAFIEAINLVEAEVAATDRDPEHVLRVVRPVFERTREKLADDIAEQRAALITGPKKKGARS